MAGVAGVVEHGRGRHDQQSVDGERQGVGDLGSFAVVQGDVGDVQIASIVERLVLTGPEPAPGAGLTANHSPGQRLLQRSGSMTLTVAHSGRQAITFGSHSGLCEWASQASCPVVDSAQSRPLRPVAYVSLGRRAGRVVVPGIRPSCEPR